MLRAKGVVGKFVEFYGEGLASLPLADRATIGNMSPEFGSTCAIFPIDAETLRYLEFSGRPPELIELVEAYAQASRGLWHDEDSEEPTFTDRLELDLSTVVPSIAGPKRPQDRVSLTESKPAFRIALEGYLPERGPGGRGDRRELPGERFGLDARAQRRRSRARQWRPAARRWSSGAGLASRSRSRTGPRPSSTTATS